MTLEEATFDDIFKELVHRFPVGVLVAVAKPPEGDADEAVVLDDRSTIAHYGAYASIGLAHMAVRKIESDLLAEMTNRNIAGDDDEEE